MSQEEHWKLESIEIAAVPTVQSVLAERQREESLISEITEEVEHIVYILFL